MTAAPAFTAPPPVHPGAPSEAEIVRRLGIAPYQPTWRAMREFTAARGPQTPDELWLVQHPPVYTMGVAGRDAHLPRSANGIEVVRTDRGGQITYHGPGQVVLYTLLDLNRRRLGVRGLVRLLENAVIDLLRERGIRGHARPEAPGVYVEAAKIAALGLRIRQGRCYHGVALNVAMDLSPFAAIDPCGYPGLAVTDLRTLGVDAPVQDIADALAAHLRRRLAEEA